ncbi:Diguanylate cyclase DosC [Fundidesulfovibrio magnetotacticus]|uniref:diguanylate cyclase n=1 Tax=Fundidesulfovibrio magnetotacticus TaxID=2730080 RepID=A0A6V8LS81_9BACT|nr:GGDEF domain-containing protein [Fundidesulfovibrio magnetotacticus]GFK92467.1 Diguanylate cyclase DosC [Fundidesulfovibrio magnetotacticus]
MKAEPDDHDAPSIGLRELLRKAGIDRNDLGEGFGEGDQAYADLLYHLTRMRFSVEDSLRYWKGIISNLEKLNAAQGRDVGLRVAICDYFQNHHPKLRSPILVERKFLLRKESDSLVDELTGLYNRHYFKKSLHREIERFKRFQHRFSLIMLVLDDFRQIAETHGQPGCEEVLRAVARTLDETARDTDHIVRYDTDTFGLILPETNCDQSLAAAERLRQTLERAPVRLNDTPVTLTASLGVACFPEDAINAKTLLERIEKALDEAKRTGNCVFSFSGKDAGATGKAPDRNPVTATVLRVTSRSMHCQSSTVILPGMEVDIVVPGEHPGESDTHLGCRVMRVLRRECQAAEGPCNFTMPLEVVTAEERRVLLHGYLFNDRPG